MKTDPTRSARDRETLTFTFERSVSASPEQVFDAWTQPKHVASWWDPTGTPLVSCTIDLRPGGAFRFVNRAHGQAFEGVYRVVERPSMLVFDAGGSIGTVRIERRGVKTCLTVTIRCASIEHFEQLVKVGVEEGTNGTLDNLVAYADRGG